MADKKRSPIRSNPLRLPGQSLQERKWDVAYDKILSPALIALFLVILALHEWWRYFAARQPNPVLYSVMALAAVGAASWRIYRALPEIRNLRLAIQGEKAVGQYLDILRGCGYRLFHDVLGDSFNIDHVLVGPAGIFTIETKTHSKPTRADAKVVFDGEQVVIDGFAPDRNPVIQAKAQASWLRELLHESCGRRYTVRPAVLYPGWFVEQVKGTSREVWVLNPKALPTFLENERHQLTEGEIGLISLHLSRFIRSTNS